jgi:hypothetical protein
MQSLGQITQLGFVRRPEALLLVDDHEPEVLEAHPLCGQRVRADDDLDRPIDEARLDALRLGRACEPREARDFDAKTCEAAAKGVKMLARQHGGRRHDRHLLAGERRSRRGPQGDFGLAEAHVAAHQPVHRAARGEVGQRVRDSARLVGRLGKGKAGREALVGLPGRRQLGGGHRLPDPREGDEPARALSDRLFDLRPALRPGLAVEAVERYALGFGAVTPHPFDFVHRGQELGLARVVETQRILRGVPGRDGVEAAQDAHAVIEMDHGVAEPELDVARWKQIGRGRLVSRSGAAAQNVRGPDDENVLGRVHEPGVEV